MKRIHSVLFLGLFLAAGTGAQSLLPVQNGDLAVSRTQSFAKESLPDVAREPVTFSYALPAEQALAPSKPHVAQSREYWAEVSGAQLRAGLPIFVSAPGALVRINPSGLAQLGGRAKDLALDPAAFEIRNAKGVALSATTATELLASSEQLAAAGAPFVEGTSAFRLAAAAGIGKLTLAASAAVDGEKYVVHVFEPQSDAVLALRALRNDYLHGQSLAVEAELQIAGVAQGLGQVQAMVTSPAGRAWPITFSRQASGSYRATAKLDANEKLAPGLWEVQIAASATKDGLTVMRGARTAFNVALPTAALRGVSKAGATASTFAVEVGSAGRYEVRGVLYGMAADGQMKPIAISHSADWLEPGARQLTLTFDQATIQASGLKAPFELRDLRLMDQGRMGLLHRQERALTLP